MRAVIKKYIKKSVGFYDDKISPYKIFVQDILYIEFTVSAKLYSVLKRTIKSHFRFNRPLFQTLLLSVHSKA